MQSDRKSADHTTSAAGVLQSHSLHGATRTPRCKNPVLARGMHLPEFEASPRRTRLQDRPKTADHTISAAGILQSRSFAWSPWTPKCKNPAFGAGSASTGVERRYYVLLRYVVRTTGRLIDQETRTQATVQDRTLA